MTTDLVQSVSLENLMSHRAALEEKLRVAYEALQEAEQVLDSVKDNVLHGHVDISIKDLFDEYNSSKRINFMDGGDEGIAKALNQVDQRLWNALFRESGIQTFMDAQARGQWHEDLNAGNFPPLTPENIKATFAGLYDQRGEFFERGVENVFQKLSWEFKSNSPVMFGRRIILEYVLTQYGGQWFHLNHDACNKIDDLIRVFSILDGQPEPDHRDGMYRQLSKAGAENAPGELTLPYFRIKWFKKGTAHIYFSRPDLVKELNRIIAKRHPGALAPAKKDAWNPKAEAEARKHAHVSDKADFFPTPMAVVDRLLDGLAFEETDRILEPSAGTGNIIQGIIKRRGARIRAIEKDEKHVATLRAIPPPMGRYPIKVLCTDFLQLNPSPDFSHAILNPPFSNAQDIDHVLHAWEFLRPGGELRAVVGAGCLESDRPRSKRFQDFLKAHDAQVEHLEAGAFKESGTMVRAAIVRIKKPMALS